MIEFLLYSEANLICIGIFLIIIIINMFTSIHNLETRPQTLLKFLGCATTFYMLDTLGRYVCMRNITVPRTLNYILDIGYFFLFVLSAVWWLIYSGTIRNRNYYIDKKNKVIIFIPAIIVFILLVLSCFTGWIFTIDINGVFHRGPIFPVYVIVSFGYIIMAGIRSLYMGFKQLETNSNKFTEFMSFAVYSFVMVITGLLQFEFGKFPILIIGNTIVVLFMYLNYKDEMIARDYLTGIYVRRKIMNLLFYNINTLKKNEELYFLFVDIDNFKYINDTYGHDEGDKILVTLASVIRTVCEKKNSYCGRWAGDEFVVIQICKKGSRFNIGEYIEQAIRKEKIMMDDKELVTMSIGCSKWNGVKDDIEQLIARADKEMYCRKREKKLARVSGN